MWPKWCLTLMASLKFFFFFPSLMSSFTITRIPFDWCRLWKRELKKTTHNKVSDSQHPSDLWGILWGAFLSEQQASSISLKEAPVKVQFISHTRSWLPAVWGRPFRHQPLSSVQQHSNTFTPSSPHSSPFFKTCLSLSLPSLCSCRLLLPHHRPVFRLLHRFISLSRVISHHWTPWGDLSCCCCCCCSSGQAPLDRKTALESLNGKHFLTRLNYRVWSAVIHIIFTLFSSLSPDWANCKMLTQL